MPFLVKDLDNSYEAGQPYHGGTRYLQKHDYRPDGRLGADPALQGRRPGHRRPHQLPRAGPAADHRAADPGPDPQPVGPRPLAGRLQRRLGRGGGRRPRAHGPRRRRRRLDPHPGQRLRPGRAEAQPGPPHQRPRERGLGRPGRSATWSAARCGTTPPPSTSSPARRRATRTRRRRPARPFAEEVGADPGALRIGWLVDDPGGVSADRARLRRRGVAAPSTCWRASATRSRRPRPPGWRATRSSATSPPASGRGRPRSWTTWRPRSASPSSRATSSRARRPSPSWAGRSRAVAVPDGARRASRPGPARSAAWWEDHDVLVLPTMPVLPTPLGAFDSPPDNPLQGMAMSTTVVLFTAPFNITGQPAISLPLHWSDDGPARRRPARGRLRPGGPAPPGRRPARGRRPLGRPRPRRSSARLSGDRLRRLDDQEAAGEVVGHLGGDLADGGQAAQAGQALVAGDQQVVAALARPPRPATVAGLARRRPWPRSRRRRPRGRPAASLATRSPSRPTDRIVRLASGRRRPRPRPAPRPAAAVAEPSVPDQHLLDHGWPPASRRGAAAVVSREGHDRPRRPL